MGHTVSAQELLPPRSSWTRGQAGILQCPGPALCWRDKKPYCSRLHSERKAILWFSKTNGPPFPPFFPFFQVTLQVMMPRKDWVWSRLRGWDWTGCACSKCIFSCSLTLCLMHFVWCLGCDFSDNCGLAVSSLWWEKKLKSWQIWCRGIIYMK